MLVCIGRVLYKNMWVYLQNQLPKWGGNCTLSGLNSEEGKVLGSWTKPPGFPRERQRRPFLEWGQGHRLSAETQEQKRAGAPPRHTISLSPRTSDLDPVRRHDILKQVKLNNDICILSLYPEWEIDGCWGGGVDVVAKESGTALTGERERMKQVRMIPSQTSTTVKSRHWGFKATPSIYWLCVLA